MANIKEIKISQNGQMVTPVVIVDSVRMQDGSKLIDAINQWTMIVPPINWTQVSQSIFPSGILSVCYGNGKFIAGGGQTVGKKSKSLMAYSTDGINWTQISQSIFKSYIRSICYGNGKYVAGNNDGQMAYSTDGINWTAISQSIFTSDINSICYENGKFIAGDDNGQMAYSTDGINWTAISQSILTSSIQSICYGKGKFVAGDYKQMAYCQTGLPL